ncbi:MAG TPA: immunoglobulin domain-containing protein [Anaerohalosphaeraceae bacterium]|nr:immunoglobulin domain-containing protein [Anaerohalosphaeraceae bacterium]
MKKLCMAAAILCLISAPVLANTVAYWRFEGGTPASCVVHTGSNGVYYPDIPDVSGNGNHLCVWQTCGGGGYIYRSEVGTPKLRLTGEANLLSVKNSGGGPAMWCSAPGLQYMTPAQFTIEAIFKLENGGYRTIVGRDSYGTNTAGTPTNTALAALYFQAVPNNALAIKFCDVAGYWHEAVSETNIFTGFDYPTNPDGVGVPWYAMAAVSDGKTLSLYLMELGVDTEYRLIAQTDMTASGSPNTALTAGAGDGGDWDAGDWSVGRGLYNGGHTDRAYGYIDEVRISDSALTPDSFLMGSSAYSPSVQLQADLVHNNVQATLQWKAPRDPDLNSSNLVNPAVVDQYVFVRNAASADPNLYYVGATGTDPGNTPESSYQMTWAFDAVYQWAIVAALEGHEQSFTVGQSTLMNVDPNNPVSEIWTFESLYSSPVITEDPAGVTVDAGGTAVFEVEAFSVSPAVYRWYKSADKSNATPADDVQVGTSSPTLTISNVSVADEGFYYCVVSNDSPVTASSAPAYLEVKRLMAWYAFENNLNDSINGYHGTAILPDPNLLMTYAAGVQGQCISLNGTNEAVEIPRTIQNGMTIAMWIKTTSTAGVGNGWFDGNGLVDGEIAGYNHNDFGTALRDSVFCFGVGDVSGAYGNVQSTKIVNDGQWHYCVATRDAQSGEIRVYVDGSLEATGSAPLGTKDEPQVLRVGSLQINLHFFAGQIDEVKLYNYPLSETEIAAIYNLATGQSVCVTSARPDAKYDLNGDCIVNLGDLAQIAAQWLNCGLYPDCL